ncbi:hypothetical protein RUESEDTHA_03703 [Ruegeria sp. THAF57]|uniref:carboxysome shell carbonic anhydrase n=1 Tax=Ruegeria sp. THAF57 TaxID=2744555 RepID=UPI0015E03DF2|nr:carboxysome shell carbonic anhydrase [Ruegeria sp. THAF57]CAD0186792.1 hypothetical protein RUESEDTHA_03703 [Ruegeria sp. THAF57]
MMTARRTKSGPNAAWKAGWVAKGTANRNLGSPSPRAVSRGAHPFAEPNIAALLDQREAAFSSRYLQLKTVLTNLAPRQFEVDFAQTAVSALAAIDIEADPNWFVADWNSPLHMGDIHARCVTRLFASVAKANPEQNLFERFDGARIEDLIARWGFHAIDITPCADGRLAGLLGAVLRVPPSIVTARRSYAGAMFNVASAVQSWEKVELQRLFAAKADQTDSRSRFLKIGAYHFSSGDPDHAGCAAHGSDDTAATNDLLKRLTQFREAIHARYDAGDEVALLLIGVDTDTDAIRVHVPDRNGDIDAARFVGSTDLYSETLDQARDTAKETVRTRVAECAKVDADDTETRGMRWFCGYLLKNNLAQVDAVTQKHGGPYPVKDHAEKLIVIGDPLDDVQQRNISFQAQMNSVEEGSDDLSVGLSILGRICADQQVSVPVLVLRRFDPLVPGDREAAIRGAQRMARAVNAATPVTPVAVEAAIRPESGGPLQFVTSKPKDTSPAEATQ